MRKYHVHFLQIGHYIAWSYLFLDSRVFNILKRKQDGNSIKMKALKVMFSGTVSTYAFKVNGYTFRGSNPAILIIVSLQSWGILFNRILLPRKVNR